MTTHHSPNRRALLTTGAALAGSLTLPVRAQSYPAKPIRWLVAYAPGGASDLAARTMAEAMAPDLGQRLLVENRPGAGGTIAAQTVASAPADGYTIGLADSAILYNNWYLFPKLSFTPESFEYVAMAGRFPLVLVVNAAVPAKTYAEWVDWVKSQKEARYATPGIGSPHHIGMALIEDRLGVRMLHVPYKGDAAASIDLLSGQISFMLMAVSTAVQYVNDPRVRLLAVSWKARLSNLPGVPTFDEVGLTDLPAYGEQGIVMPAGTPAAIVRRMNEAVGKALDVAAVRTKLEGIGMYPLTMSPEQFKEHVAKHARLAGDVIRRKNITIG